MKPSLFFSSVHPLPHWHAQLVRWEPHWEVGLFFLVAKLGSPTTCSLIPLASKGWFFQWLREPNQKHDYTPSWTYYIQLFLRNSFPKTKKNYISVTSKDVSELISPKNRLHVFVCDSDNYMVNCLESFSWITSFQLRKIMFLEFILPFWTMNRGLSKLSGFGIPSPQDEQNSSPTPLSGRRSIVGFASSSFLQDTKYPHTENPPKFR